MKLSERCRILMGKEIFATLFPLVKELAERLEALEAKQYPTDLAQMQATISGHKHTSADPAEIELPDDTYTNDAGVIVKIFRLGNNVMLTWFDVPGAPPNGAQYARDGKTYDLQMMRLDLESLRAKKAGDQ